MDDGDGWGHIADILLQYKQDPQQTRDEKKRKGDEDSIGQPLPSWMQQNILFSGDMYEAAEYLEINTEYFAAPPRKRKKPKVKKTEEYISSQIERGDSDILNESLSQNTAPNIPLDNELLATLKKHFEDLQNIPPPHNMPPQFSYLRETTLLAEALDELELFNLKDEGLAEITRHFMSLEESSYVQCLNFAKHALLPKIKGLTTTASRALVGALVRSAKLHPAPIMHALLIPLVVDDTGPVQSEVANRIAFVEKCLSPELCQEFMREVISKKQVWTDPFVVLITNALNLNIQLTDEIGTLIVTQASKQVDAFSHNPKFAKLILIYITKYPVQAKQNVLLFQQILSKCKNFMAKSALTQLEKI